MSEKEGDDIWDFSPVYNLLQQFSINGNEAVKRGDLQRTKGEANGDGSSSFDLRNTPNGEIPDPGLGNFDKIWEFLSLPPQEALSVVNDGTSESQDATGNETREPKIVKWRDEIDGADLADNDDTGELFDMSKLTKKQRMKMVRRLRKAHGQKFLPHKAIAAATSSENETEKEDTRKRAFDSKAVIDQLLYGSTATQPNMPSSPWTKTLDAHELQLVSEAWPVAKPKTSRKHLPTSLEAPPTALAVAAARKETLMKMLNERFPDERQFLDSISILPHPKESSEPIPEGLHVFVDASNILIGFHDSLKAFHSIHKEVRIRRQPLSFHSFSLLLTRGRPTSKLVLVGSDNFPAIVEAKALGYETNILDRVHKARELTDRQKYFSHRKSLSRGGEFSTGSGSETGPGTATHAHKKWVEQAVDEILHLKMMESIVDCPEPGTMILASGDAAEAEYSGGFLKMVERSLTKGWKVEVACFRANTSGVYRRKDFRERWAGKFKLVELDDFVEVLQGIE